MIELFYTVLQCRNNIRRVIVSQLEGYLSIMMGAVMGDKISQRCTCPHIAPFILQYYSQSLIRTMAEFQIYNPAPIPESSRRRAPMSPIREDLDFYLRKCTRLEEDVLTISDELNKARLRLRRAEDFQIKYDMLIKQKLALEDQEIAMQKQLFQARSKYESVSLLLGERENKGVEINLERLRLLKQIEGWKEKALQAEERSKVTVAEQQNRANERIERELTILRRNFSQSEKEHKFQIQRLTKEVHELSSTDNKSNERNDKIRKEKDNEIARLQRVVQKQREDFLQMLEEKNAEIEKIREHFQQIYNDQIGHLQQNMTSQDHRFALQLDGLRQIIQMKNDEIDKLHSELATALENNAKEREELNREIQLLKDKIYERQRANEQELFNMKERLTSLHAVDIEAMRKHYDDLVDSLKSERQELQTLMQQKDRKMEFERRQFERGREELHGVIEQKNETFKELKDKHINTGESNSSEINNLQENVSKLAHEKESMSTEYQANITFLNQQITKLIASNELKNNEIRELHEYIALLKKEQFESLKELEMKWKNERKERENEREKERALREKVEGELMEKEKEWKNRERELERDIEKERREKNKWVINNDKLEKEIERLVHENTELEESCKVELTKNQKTIIHTGGAKRELANELERQKTDLQALKRMELDQIKKKYELELTRLTNSNERLQTELSNKKIDYEKLEAEFKKISGQYRNIDKLNKEKLVDYQKKMATLDSEILLTQNLYKSFIDAKSRVVKKE